MQPWRRLMPDEKLEVRRQRAAIRTLVEGRDFRRCASRLPHPALQFPRLTTPRLASAS